MIDETRYAFGLDIEQYSSLPGNLYDFRVAALHTNPTIRFMICRTGISWGYKDTMFDYNWEGIRDMDLYRLEAGIETYPVGRAAYHVLYPSQPAITQADNMFNIIKNRADWDHDRLVIDLELHQFQDKRTITDRTKQFAYICKERTGRYPILYSRSCWMDYYALPKELTFMDVWLSQYLYPVPSGYTPEKRPPPNLPSYYTDWLVHQTGDHCEPIGSSVKKVMDYNRWNGGADVVAKYFNYKLTEQPEEPLTIESLDKRLKIIEEHLGIGR